VRAIERFRSFGAHIVSLGMVAMSDTRQEMTPGQRRLASFVTNRLHLLEGRRTLFNFKHKFHPRWESRYIVTSTTLALPKIALAVLRLRNYTGGGLVRLIK
jgi:phosphatidylglycerol lysyltransferase